MILRSTSFMTAFVGMLLRHLSIYSALWSPQFIIKADELMIPTPQLIVNLPIFREGDGIQISFELYDNEDVNQATLEFCNRHGFNFEVAMMIIDHVNFNTFGLPVVNSFDIFDTIIARDVFNPTDIFHIIEKEFPFPNFHQLRNRAYSPSLKHKSARSQDAFEKIYAHFQELTGLDDDTLLRLKEFEIQCELNHTYLLTENYDLVRDGDILVSDMYFNATVLRMILDKAGYKRVTNIHVYSGGKSNNGWLWPRLKRIYNIKSHLGDNFYSDVEQARRYNISATHSTVHLLSTLETSLIQSHNGSESALKLTLLLRKFRHLNPYGYPADQESTQYTVDSFCSDVSRHNLDELLVTVHNDIDISNTKSNEFLPRCRSVFNFVEVPVQVVPTPHNPFVFLHIEKCAGSTIRQLVAESALLSDLQSFVPCYDRLLCELTSLQHDHIRYHTDDEHSMNSLKRDLAAVSVLAGHFSWYVWNDLPAFKDALNREPNAVYTQQVTEEDEAKVDTDGQKTTVEHTAADSAPPPLAPSVFLMGRHPLPRVISYYYQRCYTNDQCLTYNRTLNSLSLKEVDWFFSEYRGWSATVLPNVWIDDGPNEALCKALTATKVFAGQIKDQLQHDAIATTTAASAAVNDDGYSESYFYLHNMSFHRAVDVSVRRVDRCVVGIQERWSESMAVLQFWFPWLVTNSHSNDEQNAISSSSRSKRRMFLNISEQETPHSLRRDIRDMILRRNRCDVQVYDHMQKRFEAQLQFINSHTTSSS